MRWIPDVLLADGTYIEIKAYVTAMAKFEFFLRPLRVLPQADLKQMFEYVWQTYGEELPSVYK